VERMRNFAAKTREVRDVQLAKRAVSGENLALMYVRDQPSGEPFWNFAGLDESGGSSNISLSDISKIWLVNTSGGVLSVPYAIMEIEVFPTLGSKELLDLHPSFSALKDSYQKVVRVRSLSGGL